MLDWFNSLFGREFIIFNEGYMVIGDLYLKFPDHFPKLNPLSFAFLFFVFIVFGLSRSFKGKIRPYLLLIASMIFLASFAWYYLVSLLLLTTISYILTFIISKTKNKFIPFISITIVTFILIFFKYQNLFKTNLLMPLGLSFVTFKIIATFVDTYRFNISINFFTYFNYVLFFPALMAGPIHRYIPFKKIVEHNQDFDYKECKNGAFLMMLGIFEKLVFCDYIGSIVNRTLIEGSYGANILLGIVLYAFQIYLDFDSYSNIAIGTAKLLGFSFEKNFNSPYLSKTIKEFWNRWHISLGTFFKDYIYIPLGGNRKGRLRKYLAIMVVFLISGIWHGSSLNFLLWGLAHGLLQIIEDSLLSVFKNKRFNKYLNWFFSAIGVVINFILVTILWQLFKYPNILDLTDIFNRLFVSSELNLELLNITHNEFVWLLIVVAVTIVLDILRNKYDLINIYSKLPFIIRWAGYILLFSIFLIFGVYGGSNAASDFIYQWF